MPFTKGLIVEAGRRSGAMLPLGSPFSAEDLRWYLATNGDFESELVEKVATVSSHQTSRFLCLALLPSSRILIEATIGSRQLSDRGNLLIHSNIFIRASEEMMFENTKTGERRVELMIQNRRIEQPQEFNDSVQAILPSTRSIRSVV